MENRAFFPTVKYEGVYLHSPYNPLKEAEKTLSQFNIRNKSLFIMFEPGLGYPVDYLKKLNPRARFILISPLDFLSESLKKQYKGSIWTKEITPKSESFLLNHIHESDLESLSYIPWPTSVRLLPKEAEKWNSLIQRVLTRLSGNHSNIIGFGRKNLKNSVINFLTGTRPRLPHLQNKHVLITAAGPTLKKNLKDIKELRNGYFLIGLPSSVKALVSYGITPDLILSIDGGYWASRHFEFFPAHIPVGMALTGRGDRTGKRDIFPLFRQNTYPENCLFGSIPLLTLPTSGTVALSAIKFALKAGAKSLTLVGLDLCMDDIRTHVTPHSFDTIIEESTSRIGGIHNAYFSRASQMTLRKTGRIRQSPSLTLFREMLSNPSQNAELYRLSPGTPELKNWKELKKLQKRPKQAVLWSNIEYPDLTERRRIIKDCLTLWKKSFIKEIQRDLIFFQSKPNDFSDFIYTLQAQKFSTLRTLSFLDDKSSYNKFLYEFIEEQLQFFSEMEVLYERLS